MAPLLLTLSICVAFAAACDNPVADSPRTGGNAARGRLLMQVNGCPACHVVPGIRKPHGKSGPTLLAFASGSFIAGAVPNTPSNLVRFEMDPTAVDSQIAMPALGLNEGEAQDVAALRLIDTAIGRQWLLPAGALDRPRRRERARSSGAVSQRFHFPRL